MILTYVSPGGVSLTFSGSSTSYRLLKTLSGFADASPDFQTVRGAWQDGSSLLQTRISEKEMSFDIMILGATRTELDTRRAALIAALNPLNGTGALYYTYEDGTQYYRTCINNGGPMIDTAGSSSTHQRATINLIAHDPFWSGSTVLTSITPSSTAWIPWYAGAWVISGTGGNTTLTNNGDYDIPVKIVIYGGTGTITGCRITNDETGEYIEVSGLIAAGDSFEINTNVNILSASEIDYAGAVTNGYPRLSLLSTFWQLQPGSNSITVSASAATLGSYITIEKTERYVGR